MEKDKQKPTLEEVAAKKEATQKAAQEKAELEAKAKADQEKAKLEAKEVAEKEVADKASKEKAELEAKAKADQEAKELAEKEVADKASKEKAELEANQVQEPKEVQRFRSIANNYAKHYPNNKAFHFCSDGQVFLGRDLAEANTRQSELDSTKTVITIEIN